MKSATANDFPDWFGPMLVKELRQGLKARGFVLSFIGLQIVLILVVIYHVVLYANSTGRFDASGLGVIFWMLIGAQLLLFTPLRALNELAAERKANTLELIFMSGLTAWRIVFGKWVSLLFQAFLFVLAVLPYAILRYYFGGVNLTEDFTVLTLMALSCAGLTALALAISGLPPAFRVASAVVIGFVMIMGMSALSAMSRFGRSGLFGMGSSGLEDIPWALQLWDALLFCLAALELGAGTVAPLAENHSGRQRLCILGLWAPVPLLVVLHGSLPVIGVQVAVFTATAALLTWYHLGEKPAALRSYLRPFRGWRAMVGLPFQPGWPSAVVFLLIALGLVLLPMALVPTFREGWRWVAATLFMSTAALLCALALQLVLARRAKHPLAVQTLVLVLAAVAFAILMAGRRSETHYGQMPGWALFPPVGVFAMHDISYSSEALTYARWGNVWLFRAGLALGGYTLLVLVLSRSYWAHYFRLSRELGNRPAAPVVPQLEPPADA